MNRHVIIKGDDYEMEGELFKDTYDDPDKKVRPPGDEIDGIVKITKSNAPNTGEEFVFCNGQPVATVGYVFSKIKREVFKRVWPPKPPEPEEGGDGGMMMAPKPQQEDKEDEDPYSEQLESTDEFDITAQKAIDFVFIDGVPICCEDKVSASSKKEVEKDGEIVQVDQKEGEGTFTVYTGHIFG